MFRSDGRQIALFHTPRGVLACNNRCPHEGYPLREGSLDERCILTCNWHNWKFDLESGRNLYGGEGLRTYPVEVRGGEVWIDLSDPPFAERRARVLSSLAEACEDNAYERMARELARLHRLGADPLDALREAVHRSFDRMEFGWTHAYAGAADWLTLHDENEGDDETRLACLLEGIAHIADDVRREPRHPFPDRTRSWDEEAFAAAVEGEDEGAAVAMVRGGLAAGLRFTDFERSFSRAALAHYNDFGHSLIYVSKVGPLIERLGPGVAEPLLLGLVRGLVFATREDLIPEYRGYGKALARWGRARNGTTPTSADWRGLGIDKALSLAAETSATPPLDLFHALLGANARNLLSFDDAHQDRIRVPVDDNVGWLSFTHGITFAKRGPEAVREVPGAVAARATADGLFQRPQRAPCARRGRGRAMAGGRCRRLPRERGRGTLRPRLRRVHRVGAPPQDGAGGARGASCGAPGRSCRPARGRTQPVSQRAPQAPAGSTKRLPGHEVRGLRRLKPVVLEPVDRTSPLSGTILPRLPRHRDHLRSESEPVLGPARTSTAMASSPRGFGDRAGVPARGSCWPTIPPMTGGTGGVGPRSALQRRTLPCSLRTAGTARDVRRETRWELRIRW